MKILSKIENAVGLILLILTSALFFYGSGQSGNSPYHITQTVTEKDNVQLIEYFDESGDSTNAPNNQYSLILKKKDPEGRILSEKYYGTDGQPVSDTNGAYGLKTDYDENGHAIRTTYVNQYDEPKNIKLGFAIIKRVFNENGTMRNAYFYDEKDQPTSSYWGEYGYYREYDEKKRTTLSTFLDVDGNAMLGNTGYASVATTYDPSTGEIATEKYYDSSGNPVALAKGQYGVKYIDGKTEFLDVDGEVFISIYTVFENYPYCVLILALAFSFVSLIGSKRFNVVLLTVYVLFVCYITLMSRNRADFRINFELFWSYRQLFNNDTLRMEILNNIELFVPIGTVLYKLFGNRSVILFCILISIMIEATQYITGLGLCEIDDVVSNTIGGFIGFSIGLLGCSLVRRERSRKNVKPESVKFISE